MSVAVLANDMLAQEARALLARLARVKPFALHEPMVPAAAISPAAQSAIERYLAAGRRKLRELVHDYLTWLSSVNGRRAHPSVAQRRFTFLRLRFNAVLTQFDLFADALTQRSEHDTGVWLSGLDVVAEDALALPQYYRSPALICYLDRGAGAAIRRARTRLPGGGENPVAIIRVPRERMVGSGIASSLVHEVGHQAAALLDLVNSFRPVLQAMHASSGRRVSAWQFWERWISEIIADFWAVARVGIASTLGLIAVVSLPRVFVFRTNLDDPHPMPWIRVKLSCAIGQALYPHPQWGALARLWDSFYPTQNVDPERRALLSMLQQGMPAFVALLAHHRPSALRGHSLAEALQVRNRQPAQLATHYQSWQGSVLQMARSAPSLVFAALGQARVDGTITPEQESDTLAALLTKWALRSTLNTAAICAALPRTRASAPVT